MGIEIKLVKKQQYFQEFHNHVHIASGCSQKYLTRQ
jgi:hypothetical protein